MNQKNLFQIILYIILVSIFLFKIFSFRACEKLNIPSTKNITHFIPECYENNKIKNKQIGWNNILGDDSSISRLKTGDLLFVSYVKNPIKYNFIKFFANSVWTHVGIFYKDPISNEPYVTEAAIYYEPYCNNFVKIPYLKWLEYNRNQLIGVLPISKEVDVNKLLEERSKMKCIKNIKDYHVQDLDISWIRFLFQRKKEWNMFKGRKGLTCHEFVIKLYKKLGIYTDEYTSSSYLPGCLFKKRIRTINGWYFKDPWILQSIENLKVCNF